MSGGGNSYKLVLLGDGRVGKTSLVSRYTEDRFSPTEESTVKAQMFKKMRLSIEGRPVEVSVWDTAGQERFYALGPLYYRNADGAVLVYDITDPDSFTRVKTWIKELKKTVGDDICLVLCGNKCDLEREKAVSESSAMDVARRHRATHFYTSAKLNKNVQEAFMDVITRAVLRRQGGGSDDPFSGVVGGSPSTADGPAGDEGYDAEAAKAAAKKKKKRLLIAEATGGDDGAAASSAAAVYGSGYDDHGGYGGDDMGGGYGGGEGGYSGGIGGDEDASTFNMFGAGAVEEENEGLGVAPSTFSRKGKKAGPSSGANGAQQRNPPAVKASGKAPPPPSRDEASRPKPVTLDQTARPAPAGAREPKKRKFPC